MVKARHEIILILSIFAIVFSAISFATVFDTPKMVFADEAVATSEWDGTTADITLGTGTQEDPYIIETAQQFAKLSELNADTKYNNINVYYKLNANINLKNRPFAGIGETGTPFKANFDGSGLTISNFRYTSSINNAVTTVNVGLFNTIEEGTIQNFAISGATISITRNGTNYGNLNCGVVCGFQTNSSDILNVSVSSAVINVQLNGSLTQVAVGGVIGRVYNNSQLSGASCFGLAITNTISSNITSLEILNTGVITGTAQSNSYISNSYCDDTNSISVVSNYASTDCYIGGIVGCLAVSSSVQKSYSNFKNLSLTTTSNGILNNIGGLVGYINDASYISNCYAKNNLFSSAISDTNKGTNNIGGLIGNAVAEANLYNSGYKFLSYSYIVADSLDTDDFGSAKVGAIIGLLDLSGAPSEHKTITTLQNTYYIAKNSQSLVDYNITGGSKYSGENISTELSNANAKDIKNYVDFDTEYVWQNDLAEPTNDGYPILMGVGNDIIPAEKVTYNITIEVYTIDENGTSEPVTQVLPVEEKSSVTYQIQVPDNFAITQTIVANEKVTLNIDQSNLLTVSNPTADDTVKIYITKDSYTVTLAVANNSGGSISFASGYTNTVWHGGSTSLVVTSNNDYKFNFETGVTISPSGYAPTQTANGFSVANITDNLTITVTFERYYTIDVEVYDENGDITTQKTFEIKQGGSETYQIIVPQNYVITNYYPIKGNVTTNIDNNNLLTISNPTSDDTVQVYINKKSYTVTLAIKDNVGGIINFANGYSNLVYHGGSTRVFVLSDNGYRFDFSTGVTLSDNTLDKTETANGFSVANITSDLTITVEFIKYYTISVTVSDTAVGLVSQDNVDFKTSLNFNVDDGDSFTVYQKVNDSKIETNLFARWKYADGTPLGTQEVLQVTPNSNLNIIAEFDIKYYKITIEIIEQTHSDNNIVKVNYVQVQNGEVVNNLQMLQSITLHYLADENCYIASVKINNDYLPQENIDYGVFPFNLVGDTTIQIEYLDYANVQVYAYSNTLTNLNNYTNDNLQNYVGFIQNPSTIYVAQKFKQTQTANVYAVVNEKYVFDGWYNSLDFDTSTAVSTNLEYSFSAQGLQTIYAKFSINTYTITFKQTLIDENGNNTITLETITADYKGSLDLTITTDLSYYDFIGIDSKCDATYDLANQKIIVTNILASDTVTVTFEKFKYDVTFNVGQGGQLQVDGTQVAQIQVYHGESIVADIAIDEGYKLYLDNIKINGNCQQNVTQTIITLDNITSAVTLNVIFTKYYTVTISTNDATMGLVGFGGSFANGFTEDFDAGSSFTLNASENDSNAFEFKRWVDQNNTEVFTNATVEITNLQQDYNLTAVFAKIGYSVSVVLDQEIANSNNNFTINNQNVNFLDGQDYGAQITINYNIDDGAYLEKIVVATSVGNQEMFPDQIQNNTITFPLLTNITATVYIKAYKFNINLSADNGSLTFDDGALVKTLTAYDTVDIIATANEGYELKDGNLTANLECFSATEPNSNGVITLSDFTSSGQPLTTINITANFTILSFGITANFGTNGDVYINNLSLTSGATYYYDYGTVLTLKFVADDLFYLNAVMLNNIDITSQLFENQYIVSSLKDNLTFDIDFGIQKFNLLLTDEFDDVTFTVKANGTTTNQTYFEASTFIEITTNCPAGYIFDGYYDQGQIISQSSYYYFYILDDVSLFAKVYATVTVEQSANGQVTINDSEYGIYEYGANAPVQISPNIGYQFVGFEDGIELSQNNTFNVTKAITLKPIFESKPVEVVVSAGENGSINTEICGSYLIGDVLNLNATIDTIGYHFAGYTGQYFGELADELVTTYTILPQDAEYGTVEIIANFEIDIFEILITSNFGGEVNPYGQKYCNYGEQLVIEIEIYDKYSIASVMINQIEQSNLIVDNNLNIEVYEDLNIEFEFAPIWWMDFAETPQGKGTSDNPFIIRTAQELAFIAAAINLNYTPVGNHVDYDFAYYKLANDIDLTGKFWTPIGTTENPFNGVFDFNYFKVTNLSVIDDVSLYQYGGLFGVIGEYGRIINQFHSYTSLILFMVIGSVVLVLLILLIIWLEKRRKKPKKVIVLPPSVLKNVNPDIANKNIQKPDLTKLQKK